MRALATFALVLTLACCTTQKAAPLADAGSQAGAPAADRIPVAIDVDGKQVVFQSEVADEPAERQRGLMFREHMADDQGMIFLFSEEEQQSFWMKNTLIPLDMIFIRADRTILGVVEDATPQTTTPRAVPGASQFVLEINGGVARRLGIRAGQRVSFYAPTPSS
jgi:uncharacterized membrane protein (UPF0127 family)